MSTATVTYHELPSSSSHWQSPEIPSDTLLQPSANGRKISISESTDYPFQIPDDVSSDAVSQPPTKRARLNSEKSKSSNSGARNQDDLCLICGDKASGFHYSSLSCDGCKGFFRRSITRKAQYSCKNSESCEINLYMRRKCQFCRMQKCKQVGMRPELVIPEEQCRKKREAKMRQQEAEVIRNEEFVLPLTNNPDLQTTHVPMISDRDLPSETSELINRLTSVDKAYYCASNSMMSTIDSVYSSSSRSTFALLAELTILEAQSTHEFVRRIPGFTTLSDADKRTIQKECKTEILILRFARKYNVLEDAIVLGNERYSFRFSKSHYILAGILPSPDRLFQLARSLSQLTSDISELALLAAICTFSDRPSLSQPYHVADLREIFTSTLQQYVEWKRPKGAMHFAALLGKLDEIKSLARDEDISSIYDSPVRPLPATLPSEWAAVPAPEPNYIFTTYPLP